MVSIRILQKTRVTMVVKRLLVALVICCISAQGLSASPRNQLTKEQHSTYFTANNSCVAPSDCPPWTECHNNQCVCREELQEFSETIKCNKDTLQLSVSMCNCVTFDNNTGEIVVGQCLENCYKPKYLEVLFLPLPTNVSALNQFMCETWNRTGRLCGKCLPGYSPLAYSYDRMGCVKCPEGNKNIWKYILVAFGPLTVFYILLLVLRINATSSYLHGYLPFAQIISSPVATRNIAVSQSLHNFTNISRIVIIINTTMFGIWNLDFFRGVYPDICLDVSNLTIIALDYAVAIYPLLLTTISYFLIELHARNVRIVVILWSPFRYVLTLIHKNWDIKTTIIDAFTTFFLLSFTKVTWTSLDLLTPVTVHSLSSNTTYHAFYYDATVTYFSKDHMPYAILGIVFCLVFVITPIMLLLCYQAKCVQRILSSLNIQPRLLQTVMDSIQGPYKDGTEAGTKDRRWFSAMPLIGQFILFLVYALLLNNSFTIPIIVSMVVLTALFQPHKTRFANYSKINIFFWGLLTLFYCAIQQHFSRSKLLSHLSDAMAFTIAEFSIFYMICVTALLILSRSRKVKILISRVKAWRRGYREIESEFEETLPDRVANPKNYTEEHNLQHPVANHVTQGTNPDNDTY